MKKLLLFILLSSSSYAFSQCTESHNVGTSINNNSNGWLWGQSFTATCSGSLNYVEFISTGTGTVSAGTLTIYSGDGVSSVLHTQSHAAIPITNAGDPMRIYISGSVPITNGNQYTFEFQVNNVATLADWNNTYPGGTSYQNGSPASVDFAFGADITTATDVKNQFIESDIAVFPNPAKDIINIATDNEINRISILAFNGSLIKEINDQSKQVTISELSKGIYMMMIYTNEGIIRKKFIKE